jgi:hypothetical protein
MSYLAVQEDLEMLTSMFLTYFSVPNSPSS